ncbi:MAG: TMEM175 family protein [Streptosporangiaceae bacterium]
MSAPLPRILAESTRVEAFSDGVLAIAITLLVLDLHTGEHSGKVGHDLLAQWPTYLAYVASFIYIGVVWVNHHALFTRIAGVDGGKLSALLLYAVISAAMAGSWLIIFVYLNRHPGLLRPGVTAGFFRTERLRAVVGISAAFVPVLVGLLNPVVGLGFIVAMPVFYAATADGLKSRRPASDAPLEQD